ncbi:hypothetical protein GCM10023324_05920 [Streptomyces youssoufiensis]
MAVSPTRDELRWAAETTDSDEHLLALLLEAKQGGEAGSTAHRADVSRDLSRAMKTASEPIVMASAVVTGVACREGWRALP